MGKYSQSTDHVNSRNGKAAGTKVTNLTPRESTKRLGTGGGASGEKATQGNRNKRS